MSSDVPLPLTSADLERVAEELIVEHGEAALEKAEERVRALRSEGFESMARTWELIRGAVLRKQEKSVLRMDSYRTALNPTA